MKTEPLTECFFYILLCLYHKPNHGYGVMQETESLTNKRVRFGSGTMYGAVSNMKKKGWIRETRSNNPEDFRKRLYQITPLGIQILEQESARLKELVHCASEIMNGRMI